MQGCGNVHGVDLRIQGAGLSVPLNRNCWALQAKEPRLRYRASGFVFERGFGVRISGFGFRVYGVSGLGFS